MDGANNQTVNGQKQTARASEGLRKSIWMELLRGRSIAVSSAILGLTATAEYNATSAIKSHHVTRRTLRVSDSTARIIERDAVAVNVTNQPEFGELLPHRGSNEATGRHGFVTLAVSLQTYKALL